MNGRSLYLDESPGERRGLLVVDGRAERLLVERDSGTPGQRLGAVVAARVVKVIPGAGLAFLDLGPGQQAVLNLNERTGRPVEGALLQVEIRTEARGDKGGVVKLIGPATGQPGVLSPGPTLEAELAALAPEAAIVTGRAARERIDEAQAEVLEPVHRLPGGGSLAIEPTRALVAVDVDVGSRDGPLAKRVSRAANEAALVEGARLLRLKGLGGLIVFDLVGGGHDGARLLSLARGAFGPDNPGVSIAPLSRFGALELVLPRRRRGALDTLTDGGFHRASSHTQALDLCRALEAAAQADPGGRFRALAPLPVFRALRPLIPALAARYGARLEAGEAAPGAPTGVAPL